MAALAVLLGAVLFAPEIPTSVKIGAIGLFLLLTLRQRG